LKTNQKIQEFLVENGKIEFLKEMLKDEFYTYNNHFIIKYIERLLKNKDVGISIDENKLQYFLFIILEWFSQI